MMLDTWRRFLVAPLLLGFVVGPSPAGTPTRDEGEVAYVVRVQGTPVGMVRETWDTRSAGRYYLFRTEIELSRMGVPMSLSVVQEGLETPSGTPKWFRSEIQASESATNSRGELKGDTIYLQSEGLGFSKEVRIPWEEGAVGVGAVDWEIRDRLKSGEMEFELRVFDPDREGFLTLRILNRGSVKETIAGEEGEYLLVEQYEGEADIPRSVTLLDSDFLPVKITAHQLAMVIEIERVNKDEDTAIPLEPNFDVIRASRIPLEGYPEAPGKIRDITLRLSFQGLEGTQVALDAPNQKVIHREGNTVDLILTRQTITKTTLSGEKSAVFLNPDRFIQSNDPAIHEIVRIVSSETGKEGWELALELATWVNHHIKKKDLGRGFASALEVLRSGEGDCTEHSVLLTSLLRAAGIPARVVSGLAYGKGFLFGHMWAEAHVGHWRTLDALDLNTDPIRIRISASKDASALNLSDLANDLSIAGGIGVEVVDYHLLED